MSNLNPGNPIQPLSVGNVVSAGVRLYRSHLNQYLTLSFKALLWSLVPVYGWAKAAEIGGVISRLAFTELIDQPETVREAQRFTRPRMWSFLLNRILLSLIWLGILVGLLLVYGLIVGIGAVAASVGGAIGVGVLVILVFAAIVGLILFMIWLGSRLFLADVPLAIEENVDASSSIGRGWNLTTGSIGRLQLIFLVAILITIAIYLPFQLVLGLLLGSLSGSLGDSSDVTTSGAFSGLQLVSFVLNLIAEALIRPYWQAIKAVVYYDLRARREGLGLQLRDR